MESLESLLCCLGIPLQSLLIAKMIDCHEILTKSLVMTQWNL
ncbi:hypothetical protein [Helicobacter sp. MIT 05-5294]|nr:hypothetical protein [Helicobacter sp. MIT 05-5294]